MNKPVNDKLTNFFILKQINYLLNLKHEMSINIINSHWLQLFNL